MTASRRAELARRVIEEAGARGLTLAVAESLTGGLLADAFVSIPGASRVLVGGIVAYDTALKHSLLGVDDELLRRSGPVDGDVARQMAAGVRRACAVPRRGSAEAPTAIGVATTGVAGPDPDPQTGQPAGTVWVAVSAGAVERQRLLDLDGDRATIRAAAVTAAIELLVECLEPGSASSAP
ncbi:CinA family protein [Leucobacter chromiiresistens]|uniref:Nicotinamide-nucleotide amidase n=1 Tax=Leucobacter chromiiresistens TaxID=1079994 RepID=A0A1H1AHX1_9MICO|nr:CinA family protein [Leucobacter chromiiresistens]SDQ39274.1 nicotinamide-nucleotide amidase [Leucobacter chromiiresistens]